MGLMELVVGSKVTGFIKPTKHSISTLIKNVLAVSNLFLLNLYLHIFPVTIKNSTMLLSLHFLIVEDCCKMHISIECCFVFIFCDTRLYELHLFCK